MNGKQSLLYGCNTVCVTFYILNSRVHPDSSCPMLCPLFLFNSTIFKKRSPVTNLKLSIDNCQSMNLLFQHTAYTCLVICLLPLTYYFILLTGVVSSFTLHTIAQLFSRFVFPEIHTIFLKYTIFSYNFFSTNLYSILSKTHITCIHRLH